MFYNGGEAHQQQKNKTGKDKSEIQTPWWW